MCLLGRKHQWLAGRYSCVAGFVEAGETLEEAVVREVAEEAGIRILPSSIRYASSQTWPFPSQLMVGFYASVSDGKALPTPQPADGELEAVAWFRADQVRTMLSPEAKAPALHLPPRKAIAHRLVADWLASLNNQNKSEVADALGHD
ncbi:Peroxisomal NADH pyrophosphatase nudt12 [Cyanidiococcus yangmingshanensis]|uniref:NAD(+) diphosphatase n=1 Tax=Cyanidiococcus yangmingshanensis TaxID=2690220 RepID=A0A7J7IIF9_9RHOD|nr:Peroxisomal NADH pyrophosphatase nudt12 [Cyanidiococcus yangmingshanensis]